MKAKKLMGMIACAGACVSLSAFANTNTNWFDVAVSNGDLVLTDVATNGVAVTIEESKIKLDGDDPLSFTPAAGKDVLSDGLVTICAKAELTPSSVSEFDSPSGAKTGFAVGIDDLGNTNYYGFANGVWTNLTGTVNPPASGDTEFKLVVDYRVPNVKFFVKSNDEYVQIGEKEGYAIATASNLTRIEASGSGSLSLVDADYEIAVAAATVNDVTKKYGSAAEAVIAAGATGTVLDIDPASGAATEEEQAANGLYAWQCDILGIEEDAAIPLQPATKEVASDKIAVAVSGYAPIDGVSVQFNVKRGGVTVAGPYDADAIGIPMETGTYTIEPEIKADNN